LQFLRAGLDAEQARRNQNGDINTAIAGAAKKVEAAYGYSYKTMRAWSR
jgi:hypothetical protein